MKLHPRVTRSAVELVKRFEGLRRRAARLPDGGWTIGYGHTRSAREGAVVSPEDADALLYYDLSEVAQKVEAWTFTPLNQNQFEALTAFAFNIGVENFRRSTVLKRVNEGQHLMAAAALELWRKADFGGEDVVVDALVRRRAAEKAHYLTPPEGFKPSPTPVLRPTFDHSVIEAAANSRAGRAAAVVDAPLEGEMATATVEHRFEPTDPQQTVFPFAAAAATGAATVSLHQLFPEKADAPLIEPAAPAPPFSLEPDTAEPPLVDAAFSPGEEPDRTVEALPSLEVPPAPKTDFTAVPVGFSGFNPPPARPFETLPPSAPTVEKPVAAEAPPLIAPSDYPDRSPLFDAPSPRDVFAPAGRGAAPYKSDEVAEIVNGHEPGPLHDRSMIYISVGLLGVALFAAALFSMFSGKATPVNLVIGLMGILLMTPAGGYFLLRFLNARDGLAQA
jgi:lysozyme